MNTEEKKPFEEYPDYPYLLFLRDKGWKYQKETEKKAAYQREVLVRQNKFLNEEEFLAETGEAYAAAAKELYPKLRLLAKAEKISPWDLLHYARYLWCMKNPEALCCTQIGSKEWAVNNCDTEITEEQAVKIVCRDWGFDAERVRIQTPAYYESTDWNYICFQCGLQKWIMHNGEIDKIYG